MLASPLRLARAAGLPTGLLLVLIALAAGVPPARAEGPPGWRALTTPAGQAWRSWVPDRADVELRLHPAERPAATLAAWFARRQQREPARIRHQGEAVGHEAQDVLVAIRRGTASRGQAVLVVAIGCRQRDGGYLYAELLTPAAPEVLERYLGAATAPLAARCTGVEPAPGGSAPAPASPGPSAAPAAGAVGLGGPLLDADITAVVYSWWQIYEITGLQMYEEIYVLLADGTVRLGLSGLRDGTTLAQDRAASAKAWGQWRRRGDGYQVRMPGQREFSTPRGALVREPGRAGERLTGTYVAASSSSIPGGASAWSRRSITFAADGTFTLASSGGAGAGDGGAGEVVTSAVWDDEGSVSAVSGPNIGGGASRRHGGSPDDRRGTYHIDGYRLELRYASGRVERRLFSTNRARTSVWFGGEERMRR